MQYDSFNRLRLYCEAEDYMGWDSFTNDIPPFEIWTDSSCPDLILILY